MVANKVQGCQALVKSEIFKWCKEELEVGRNVMRLKICEFQPRAKQRNSEKLLYKATIARMRQSTTTN